MEAINGTPVIHTLAEAADILRVKESWLQRKAARREIPFTMLARAYHFTPEHLVEIIRQNENWPAGNQRDTGTRRPARMADTAAVMLLRPRSRKTGPRYAA